MARGPCPLESSFFYADFVFLYFVWWVFQEQAIVQGKVPARGKLKFPSTSYHKVPTTLGSLIRPNDSVTVCLLLWNCRAEYPVGLILSFIWFHWCDHLGVHDMCFWELVASYYPTPLGNIGFSTLSWTSCNLFSVSCTVVNDLQSTLQVVCFVVRNSRPHLCVCRSEEFPPTFRTPSPSWLLSLLLVSIADRYVQRSFGFFKNLM